jgi:nitrile hydratase subunit beta
LEAVVRFAGDLGGQPSCEAIGIGGDSTERKQLSTMISGALGPRNHGKLRELDGVHDMGGMHGFGSVVEPGAERAYDEPWEGRAFAMSEIIGTQGLGTGGGRPLREQMDPAEYLRASYYERWLWSNERRLERKGAIAPGEVDAWVERLRGGDEVPRRSDPELAARAVAAERETSTLAPARDARFAAGDRVRVERMRPEGHTRCPRYVRGVEGVVESVRGNDAFPDIGPYQGPPEPVYAVAFVSEDLFGASEEGTWTVMVDLFDSYLEPA